MKIDESVQFDASKRCEEHRDRLGHNIIVRNGSSRGNFRGTFCRECIADMTARGFNVRTVK